jgi:ribonuclease J
VGSGPVRVIPLGGTGEIGKNMYVVEAADGRMVVIDCGVTFPNHDQFGVDLVLPDFSYVEERADRLEAVILTHGHEDHIGALPYLIRAVGQVPIYGAKFTLGLVRSKLDEHRQLADAELVDVEYGTPMEIGPFTALFIPLTHSIPDCAAVALETSAGWILHTGDFKLDHTPIGGRPTDIAALARLGDRGVTLMLADSTNADNPGAVRPERTVGEEFARVFAIAAGRVVVTTFSSHIHRVQQVLDAAYRDGRVVALVGRSLVKNANIAINLGYLKPPPGVLVRPKDLDHHRPDEQVILSTGSQGEPLAALSRIARGEHHQVTISPGDTVVYSSRTVPGNELAVSEVINRLVRARARVITQESLPAIHVSGHGTATDLLMMLQLVRPKFFAPIHGEARHQRAHADLAESLGIADERIFILDNGDVLGVETDGAAIVDKVHAGLTFVDRMGGSDVAESVMRDRRHLSEDGLVLVIATVNASDGSPIGEAEIITRGFGSGDDEELIEETRLEVERSLTASAAQRVTEVGVLQHQLHDAVASLVKRRTQQRPLVVPVIVEV